jgi:hypothetical protein
MKLQYLVLSAVLQSCLTSSILQPQLDLSNSPNSQAGVNVNNVPNQQAEMNVNPETVSQENFIGPATSNFKNAETSFTSTVSTPPTQQNMPHHFYSSKPIEVKNQDVLTGFLPNANSETLRINSAIPHDHFQNTQQNNPQVHEFLKNQENSAGFIQSAQFPNRNTELPLSGSIPPSAQDQFQPTQNTNNPPQFAKNQNYMEAFMSKPYLQNSNSGSNYRMPEIQYPMRQNYPSNQDVPHFPNYESRYPSHSHAPNYPNMMNPEFYPQIPQPYPENGVQTDPMYMPNVPHVNPNSKKNQNRNRKKLAEILKNSTITITETVIEISPNTKSDKPPHASTFPAQGMPSNNFHALETPTNDPRSIVKNNVNSFFNWSHQNEKKMNLKKTFKKIQKASEAAIQSSMYLSVIVSIVVGIVAVIGALTFKTVKVILKK